MRWILLFVSLIVSVQVIGCKNGENRSKASAIKNYWEEPKGKAQAAGSGVEDHDRRVAEQIDQLDQSEELDEEDGGEEDNGEGESEGED